MITREHIKKMKLTYKRYWVFATITLQNNWLYKVKTSVDRFWQYETLKKAILTTLKESNLFN